MSKYHGNSGVIEIGTSNALAEDQSWNYDEEDVNIVDASAMGDAAEVPVASGCKRGSGAIECYWDDADADGQDALAVGDTVTATLYPGGNDAGKTNYSGPVVVSKRGIKGGKEGMNTISFEFKGVLTEGTVS